MWTNFLSFFFNKLHTQSSRPCITVQKRIKTILWQYCTLVKSKRHKLHPQYLSKIGLDSTLSVVQHIFSIYFLLLLLKIGKCSSVCTDKSSLLHTWMRTSVEERRQGTANRLNDTWWHDGVINVRNTNFVLLPLWYSHTHCLLSPACCLNLYIFFALQNDA